MEPTKPAIRTNYFDGQHLTADDFARDQEYFRERLRRHNRALHGWGVVSGLDLEVVPDRDKAAATTLTVSPGYALSPRGDEILVNERVSQALALPANPRIVAIRYDERPVDPVPSAGSTPGGDGVQFRAVEETYLLEVFEARPDPTDDRWVILGMVACDEDGQLGIDTSARQHAKECR